jgi:cobalt-precorrin-6B (C15)-methyltransferase
MQDMGIFEEAVHVQVAKSYPLAGDVAFKPLNPVYIIVGIVSGINKGAP